MGNGCKAASYLFPLPVAVSLAWVVKFARVNSIQQFEEGDRPALEKS